MKKDLTVTVGDIWCDRDPRMKGRRVRVTRVDVDGFVSYEHLADPRIKHRSRYLRFTKAFTPDAAARGSE